MVQQQEPSQLPYPGQPSPTAPNHQRNDADDQRHSDDFFPPNAQYEDQQEELEQSSQFYSTNIQPMSDPATSQTPQVDHESVLHRPRPKSPARPSSFFASELSHEPVAGERVSDWVGASGQVGSRAEAARPSPAEGEDTTFTSRPSSFFGARAESPDPELELSGYNGYRGTREEETTSHGGTNAPPTFQKHRSSFYGLDSQLPPSTSTSASHSKHRSVSQPASNVRDPQNPRDSGSGSSLSHDARAGVPRYHNAPYAASRAASVYGMSGEASGPPLLDQSHLRPGVLASLLSHDKTLDLYRANAKKTNDPDIQFEFCTFVMEVVGEMEVAGGLSEQEGSAEMAASKEKQHALVGESVALLAKLANRGHVKSQYFLADCYTQGVGTLKGKRDYDKAFPLFVLAAKHGHHDASFRAGQCCENGWGCKKDFPKSVTFYRRAAVLNHAGAMHRLGLAEINGELGLTKRPREGVKWLKRAAELADQVDPPQPQSLHELALLHEKGIDNIIFKDEEYAAELLARAAELQWAPSAFKLGECYEYGRMGCPQDAALSIHYYNIAAQQNHREACFALTAWYLVGSPGVLPQSDTEAYLWAKKAADMGLAKAEYAVGYFTEVGIGTFKDGRDALKWFQKAADQGDKRAKDRLRLVGSTSRGETPFTRPNQPDPRPSSSSPAPLPPPSQYKPPPPTNPTRLQRKGKDRSFEEGQQRRASVDPRQLDSRGGGAGRPPSSNQYGEPLERPPPISGLQQASYSQPDLVGHAHEAYQYTRGGGGGPTQNGESNSPYGQYEDLALPSGGAVPNNYGRPAPQQRFVSAPVVPNGYGKAVGGGGGLPPGAAGGGRPLEPHQMRMPERQQRDASPVSRGDERERRETREKVLEKKKRGDNTKGEDKDCVVS